MNAPNAELAYRVLDHIDAHPEQWNQGLWVGKAECGTLACFAGWAVLLSGFAPDFGPDHSHSRRDGTLASPICVVDGHAESVSYRAQILLNANRWVRGGFDDEEDLFDSCNTREDLGRLVAEIFGPRPDGDVS